MDIIAKLSEELSIKETQIRAAVELMDEGNTIPFIARYRKEVTGSLDDEQLRALEERLNYLRNLEKRKEEVRAAITEQGKMTEEIDSALESAQILAEVEDIYRPFKQKRKTRASVARERGLTPLAELLMEQKDNYTPSLYEEAEKYINEEKGVKDAKSAVAGALDIIAEDISDNADFRKEIRALTYEYGFLSSKKAKEEASVYEMYYDYSEKLTTVPSHRVLAINRGENEEFLKASVDISADIILNYLASMVITNVKSPAYNNVLFAVADSYFRLIAPSIEREIRSDLFDKASEGAIKLFSQNLKNLLMQAPIKNKTVLGLDPGYRTGCKLAVVDKTGKVLDTAVIYPTKPQERTEEAARIVKKLITKYDVDVVSIGNGTASKESEIFISGVLRELGGKTKYIVTSEAGASVYSASKLGAEEFPDFDVTQRSAVSIARRIQDSLAELVKIDPKSIGVGQYQHDMKEARLDEALSGVVEDCVNSVGVDVNTASYSLLEHIAGINATAAKNIVKYREENGEFTNRAQILKVPKIGAKAFQQCAGFLRVSGSSEILDNTGIHPESYGVAKKIISKFGYTEDDVKGFRLKGLEKTAEIYGMGKIAEEVGAGEPTVRDIVKELEKPGRDIREDLPMPELRSDILDMNDLQVGMILNGVVRNVIDFGAFVDIGVHQDGLVHVSEICKKFIKHPSEALSVGDHVRVKIKSIDKNKGRIGLTMKDI
ncbi:MAG: RNA-binding transcriptional accessory protein [Ruminococcaceae bacterium]|nr:RNA-binding transcriptional accessory protein [Oscillospiraceae bacterium]